MSRSICLSRNPYCCELKRCWVTVTERKSVCDMCAACLDRKIESMDTVMDDEEDDDEDMADDYMTTDDNPDQTEEYLVVDAEDEKMEGASFLYHFCANAMISDPFA